MRTAMLLTAMLFLSSLIAAQTHPSTPFETGFLNRRITFAGQEYNYQVYLPANWRPQQKWPVILFLHGYGESGSDGIASTDVGLASAIRQNPAHFPFVVVLPQCPWGHWWSDDEMSRMALAALDAEIKEFNGDPERVYLTGLSMGGYGSWYIASHYPGKFAAIAPVCGGLRLPFDPNYNREAGVYDQTARAIGKTPVWIFHGGADDTVPVEESRQMFAALKKSGGVVRYYEYEGVGHNSWDKAYAEPEFPQWLLSKRLGRGESSPAEMKVVPAHPAAVQVDAKILAQYAGVYEHEMRPVAMVRQSVIFENGGLNLQFGANRIVPLLALSEQEFFTEKPEDVRYIFQRNSRGEVGSFIRRDKRHDEVFRRVAH